MFWQLIATLFILCAFIFCEHLSDCLRVIISFYIFLSLLVSQGKVLPHYCSHFAPGAFAADTLADNFLRIAYKGYTAKPKL